MNVNYTLDKYIIHEIYSRKIQCMKYVPEKAQCMKYVPQKVQCMKYVPHKVQSISTMIFRFSNMSLNSRYNTNENQSQKDIIMHSMCQEVIQPSGKLGIVPAVHSCMAHLLSPPSVALCHVPALCCKSNSTSSCHGACLA